MLPALLLQMNDCVVVDQGSPVAWDEGVYCASPSIRSAPAPPSIVSAPAPPNSTSLRRLPCQLSTPPSPPTPPPPPSPSTPAPVAAAVAVCGRGRVLCFVVATAPTLVVAGAAHQHIRFVAAEGDIVVRRRGAGASGAGADEITPRATDHPVVATGRADIVAQPASGIDHIRIGAALKGIASAAPAKAHAPGGLGAIEGHVVCTQGKMQQYAV